MALVYRFRVTFEDYDEVTRDIEIKSTQTFEDFHLTIQACIGFDGSKPASFYISNDNWIKGQEITSTVKQDANGNNVPLMKDSKLNAFIADPHQKIYYVSDFESPWTFFIELVKILPHAEDMKMYPVCVKSTGEAPKQYSVLSKPVVADEDFDESMVTEDVSIADEIAEETEDGVEIDEIEGMSEEGDDDVMEEESELGEETGEAEEKNEEY